MENMDDKDLIKEKINDMLYPFIDDIFVCKKLSEDIVNLLEEHPPTWYLHG